MSEEEYYVKAIVDGVAIDDEDLCSGRPTSRSCQYKVNNLNYHLSHRMRNLTVCICQTLRKHVHVIYRNFLENFQ